MISRIHALAQPLSLYHHITGLLRRLPFSFAPPTEDIAETYPAIGYGPYSALGLASGLILLSGGERTFRVDKKGAAYLFISLFPQVSKTTADNDRYLQALRHFYVLATERKPMDQLQSSSDRVRHVRTTDM